MGDRDKSIIMEQKRGDHTIRILPLLVCDAKYVNIGETCNEIATCGLRATQIEYTSKDGEYWEPVADDITHAVYACEKHKDMLFKQITEDVVFRGVEK